MLKARAAVQNLPTYDPPLAGRDGLRLDFNENTIGCSARVVARLQSMTAGGRWYPALTTLGDGRVFTVSGGPNHAETYSSVTGWSQLPQQNGWPLFPHVFLQRNGHVFFSGGNVFANPVGLLPGSLNLSTNAQLLQYAINWYASRSRA